MLITTIRDEGVVAGLHYHEMSHSFLVRIFVNNTQVVTKSFGNGVSAEDFLLEEMTNIPWLILRYA